MNYKRYLAELLGTFFLTFVVYLSVAFAMPFSTPVMAAVTLGLFVYFIGGLSGSHINPAVTIGLWSIRRISARDALSYILAQFIGAFIAMAIASSMAGEASTVGYENLVSVGLAEAFGAFIFTFGIASVVYGKTPAMMSGVVVGLSLFLGIYVASPLSNAVLNPAVAFGIGSFGIMYILGPIVGSIAGFWAFTWLLQEKLPKKA